jgi:Fic family protein
LEKGRVCGKIATSSGFLGCSSNPLTAELRRLQTQVYFSETILQAQRTTMSHVDFYVAKAKLHEDLRGKLNARQDKAMARMFREGFDGFKGGLSAENYISITQASRATSTRDLADLVANGALTKTGELRHTRYHLNISVPREANSE